MNEKIKPIVISIVSGKGGVGKTRISLSLAMFLSKSLKVLLIDFDLHNQGLTHLLDDYREKNTNESSSFDYLYSKNYVKPIKLLENLYFISASKPALESTQKEVENLNRKYTSVEFKNILLNLIDDAKRNDSVNCIIIDNTGIPDDFSIGSSLAADEILLITQPDNITWRGALNFYRIFQNNGGDPTKINFIVNNIPKKYSFELVDLEANKIGKLLQNLGFTIFIPFEYGIFESFDKNPLDNSYIQNSQFYKKIELLSAIILKESNLDQLVTNEIQQIYDNQSEINKSLEIRLDRSYEEKIKLPFARKMRFIFSIYFAIIGIFLAVVYKPQLIPSFIRETNPIILMIILMFFLSVMSLILPEKTFFKIFEIMRKSNR